MDASVVIASGAASLAAVGCGVAALVVLHVLPTGLSPVRNAVSQYGISAYRLGYRVQALAYAVAGLAVAIGLVALPRPPAAAVALCLVFAATRALISWFPMDAPSSRSTSTGRRHGLLAIAAFVALTAAANKLSGVTTDDHLGGLIRTGSATLGALMAVALAAMFVSRRVPATAGWFGALERAFYLFATLWLAVVAVALLRAG